MDITGARWTTDGAQAVLALRAVITNGDFDTYWAFQCSSKNSAATTSTTTKHNSTSRPKRSPGHSRRATPIVISTGPDAYRRPDGIGVVPLFR